MNVETGWYSNVHPVLRIICFIILSLFLALGNLGQLAGAACVIALLFVTVGRQVYIGLWPMLRRMRWFFLSIFIIYAWLTPGESLLSGVDSVAWLPTSTGVLEGVQRLLALVFIIAAVHWLLFVTKRDQLVSALYWLAAPIQLFGLSRQRFAVRVALILHRVVDVQDLVGQKVRQAGVNKGDIKAYAAVTAALTEEVIALAEQSPCQQIEIDVADKPPIWQWALPLLLLAVMFLFGGLA